MADPIVTDGVVEAVKVPGYGGLGMIALAVWQRFTKKEDDTDKLIMSMLTEIKAGQVITQASVASLSGDVRVLTDRNMRSDAEQAQMRVELTDLRMKVASLEGRVQQLSTGRVIE